MKFSTCSRMPSNDQEWHILDKILLTYIKNCLYTYHIIHWLGAEPELADDVLQETYLRVLRFARTADNAHAIAINNFEAFCKTTAIRYILDMYRKDKRLVGSLDDDHFSASHATISISEDPAELVLADMSLYSSMLTFSQIVKRFPEKQRTAILIDLARNTDFDEDNPRPLVRAMRTIGIQLHHYRLALPRDPVLRSRHNALVCLAYQRLHLVYFNMLSQPTSAA